jgi:hypothetical protein
LLLKESEFGRVEQEIVEVDAFVATLEARVLALAA